LTLAEDRKRAYFLYAPVFRRPAFGNLHPLSISRLSVVEDVCASLDWFGVGCRFECAPASENTLMRFHDASYIAALKSAVLRGEASVSDRERYEFGTMQNPIFPGLFERAATTVGGAILAAELALGGAVAVHFGGGTHHGKRDRAHGFCYFNDPVFAILTLLDGGAKRVAYVDLDAHHGDGVEAAFAGDERVMLASIHEERRWPFTGAADQGPANAFNAPVPAAFNDTELEYLLAEWLLPSIEIYRPDAVVITCGADGLSGDPLSAMELSNGALQNAVMALVSLTPAAVVLGGGGYNPWTATRLWAGLWGRLIGRVAPQPLPAAAREILGGLTCDLVDDDECDPAWLMRLDDAPRRGPLRTGVSELSARLAARSRSAHSMIRSR